MHTLTANDAKRNFGELLLNAQHEPVIISKNTVVVMSMKDFEELEAMKLDYLKHCFESAKKDLGSDATVDSDAFINSL